jgi:hypothetical protein
MMSIHVGASSAFVFVIILARHPFPSVLVFLYSVENKHTGNKRSKEEGKKKFVFSLSLSIETFSVEKTNLTRSVISGVVKETVFTGENSFSLV